MLLSYLVRNGSERVVTSAREHIYDMKPLEDYTFKDEQGKDQGINGEKGLIQELRGESSIRTGCFCLMIFNDF